MEPTLTPEASTPAHDHNPGQQPLCRINYYGTLQLQDSARAGIAQPRPCEEAGVVMRMPGLWEPRSSSRTAVKHSVSLNPGQSVSTHILWWISGTKVHGFTLRMIVTQLSRTRVRTWGRRTQQPKRDRKDGPRLRATLPPSLGRRARRPKIEKGQRLGATLPPSQGRRTR
ncbi:UNVERIFIED_CONTAM: hypothetical protein FKN15_013142 [Acipenser sinensis]